MGVIEAAMDGGCKEAVSLSVKVSHDSGDWRMGAVLMWDRARRAGRQPCDGDLRGKSKPQGRHQLPANREPGGHCLGRVGAGR